MWMRMRGQNNWRLTYSRFFPWILQLTDWPALETDFFFHSQIFEMISCKWIVVNSGLIFLESAYRLLGSAKLYREKWKQHLAEVQIYHTSLHVIVLMMMEVLAPPVFPVFEPLLSTFGERTEEPMNKVHDHVRAAICNQCPWCKNIFASVRVTQQHIRRRLQHGLCRGSGSAFTTAVIEPPLLQCPFCTNDVASRESLFDCIVSHFH